MVYKGRNSTLYIGPISSAGCSSDSMLILRGILLPGEYMTITIFEQWSKAWLFAAYKEVYRTQLCVGLLIDHYKDSLLNKQYNGMSYQTHLQLPTVNFQVLCYVSGRVRVLKVAHLSPFSELLDQRAVLPVIFQGKLADSMKAEDRRRVFGC